MKSNWPRCGLFLILLAAWMIFGLAGCSASDLLSSFYTATATGTRTATATLSPTPSATASSTQTSSATVTASRTTIPSDTATQTLTSSPVPPSSSITPGPSPTTTRTATRTPRTPTITNTPTITLTPTQTQTSTITLTPTPHLAFLRLSQPGWMSKVTSPVHLSSIASPGDDGFIYVNLIGEDGRTITHFEQRYYSRQGERFFFDRYLDFNIPGPAEYGRLEIRTRDKWGRDVSISSVDLLLLSVGNSELFDPLSLLEPYIIWYPHEGAIITGGSLLVSGLVQPVNQNPIIFELIDDGGKIVGSTRIDAPRIEPGQTHAQFAAAVPYQLDAGAEARLIIRQESLSRIPGTVALSSMRLILAP